MADEDDYEVGYGKPPKKTRFPKGVSGNPKGRPKGRVNLNALVHKICNRKMGMAVNGEASSVVLLEAAFMQLGQQAVAGNLKALAMLLPLKRAADQSEENLRRETPDAEKDQIAIQSLRSRLHMGGTSPSEEEDED